MIIHPATVHFAIVLPVVAAVFGLIYLFTKSEIFAKISSASFIIAAIATGVVWYTGSQAGPEVYKYLSHAGQTTLLEHKKLGLYLAIAMAIIALIKVIGCRMHNYAIQALSVILIIGAMAATFYQGKMGGEIAYNYGMPFKSYMTMETLNEANKDADDTDDADSQVEIYQDAIDDITSLSEDVNVILGNPKPTDDDESEEE